MGYIKTLLWEYLYMATIYILNNHIILMDSLVLSRNMGFL